jgi:hypothetical protein
MAAFRPIGTRGMSEETLNPGDVELVSGVVAQDTTAGNDTLTATALLTGSITRSGPSGAFTDTLDTASNIYNALAGNASAPSVAPGLGFACRITNTTAFTQTISLGTGHLTGVGTIGSVAANSWRDFLFSFTAVQPNLTVVGNVTSGSNVVTWTLPAGQSALNEGVAPNAVNINVGATIYGTNIPSGSTVTGIMQGVGGTIGVTMSANATGTSANIALGFCSTITVNSSGSGSK